MVGVGASVSGSREQGQGRSGRNGGGSPEGRDGRGNLRGDGREEGLRHAGGDRDCDAGRDDSAVSDGWQLGHGLHGVDNHLDIKEIEEVV